MSKYINLVESAQSKRKRTVISDDSPISLKFSQGQMDWSLWATELDVINQHITIKQEKIGDAISFYEELANHLVEELNWSRDDINIFPQGSASTQTLVNSPDRSKFDIDAVCQVNSPRLDPADPQSFYDEIGEALEKYDAEGKKRCWRINHAGHEYYLEFTPSIPLSMVPNEIRESFRYQTAKEYEDTALAVVNTPTRSWKTSNPAGFTGWVSNQAERSVNLYRIAEATTDYASTNVEPVPIQAVPLSDTLRVAIRLFKRHRDMAVKRGNIEKEFQPISVIIVTLLTQCFEGLLDLQKSYSHPIEMLIDLAELLPNMIEYKSGEYWVANPTVDGENFAERWNEDNGERHGAFQNWCELLISDLGSILMAEDETEIKNLLRTVFGCTDATPSPTSGISGLAPERPTSIPRQPKETGLA